jgi:hypothetical protein
LSTERCGEIGRINVVPDVYVEVGHTSAHGVTPFMSHANLPDTTRKYQNLEISFRRIYFSKKIKKDQNTKKISSRPTIPWHEKRKGTVMLDLFIISINIILSMMLLYSVRRTVSFMLLWVSDPYVYSIIRMWIMFFYRNRTTGPLAL